MFVDYYAVLEINFDVPQEAIKSAFKTEALRWHPDRNPGIDTTLRMQEINEAYIILKDPEARQRYDIEYQIYREHQKQAYNYQEKQRKNAKENKQERREPFSKTFQDNTYEILDETLNKWMSNARKQAVSLGKQTIDDIIGISIVSGKAMGVQMLQGTGRLIVFSILMAILFKACH